MVDEINVAYFGEEIELQKQDINDINELTTGLYGHIAAFALEYHLSRNLQNYTLMLSAFSDIYEHRITAKQVRGIAVSIYISAKNSLLPDVPKHVLIRTALKFLRYYMLIEKLSLYDIFDLVTAPNDESYAKITEAHKWMVNN